MELLVYINGTNNNSSVADAFATQFESVYCSVVNDCDKNEIENLLSEMPYSENCVDL